MRAPTQERPRWSSPPRAVPAACRAFGLTLAVLAGAPAAAQEADALAPFSPSRGDRVTVSDPASVIVAYDDPPLAFSHQVEFLAASGERRATARLEARGGTGRRLIARGWAAFEGEGQASLRLLDPGGTMPPQRRRLRPGPGRPFRFELEQPAGRQLDLVLVVSGNLSGQVWNLTLEDAQAAAPEEAPLHSSYARRPVVPEEVQDRNLLRYMEVLQRDLTRLSELAYAFTLYALWLAAALLIAWLAHRAARRPGRRPAASTLLRGLALTAAAGVALLLAAPLAEWAWRMRMAAVHDMPAFLTYPFGFVIDTPERLGYQRNNVYRFEQQVDGLPVPHMTPGTERWMRGSTFFTATVNEAGYRGALRPLPRDARVLLCIGGSSTYGLNDDGETYPDFLQAALDRAPAGSPPWVVFNLGVPGIHADRFLGRLQHVISVQPDVIVIYAGFNDTTEGVGDTMTPAMALLQEDALTPAAHYSLICRELVTRRFARNPRLLALAEHQAGRLVASHLGRMRARARAYAETIDAVFAYAAAEGARVLYVEEYALRGQHTSLQVQRQLRESAHGDRVLERSHLPAPERAQLQQALLQLEVRRAAAGPDREHVTCVEPVCFEGLSPEGLLHDVVHLTTQGNRLLGEFVAQRCLELAPADPAGAQQR